jgi:hypothetical protein
MNRRLITQMDEIRFPTLGSILGNKYGHYHSTGEAKSAAAAAAAVSDDTVSLLCPLCLVFKAKNAVALAAHRRGCGKKK